MSLFINFHWVTFHCHLTHTDPLMCTISLFCTSLHYFVHYLKNLGIAPGLWAWDLIHNMWPYFSLQFFFCHQIKLLLVQFSGTSYSTDIHSHFRTLHLVELDSFHFLWVSSIPSIVVTVVYLSGFIISCNNLDTKVGNCRYDGWCRLV